MLKGLLSGMSVPGGSSISNFGLQCVSDQACRSQTKHVGLRWGMAVSDESPIKHVEVSDQTCQSPMGLRSLIGLR